MFKGVLFAMESLTNLDIVWKSREFWSLDALRCCLVGALDSNVNIFKRQSFTGWDHELHPHGGHQLPWKGRWYGEILPISFMTNHATYWEHNPTWVFPRVLTVRVHQLGEKAPTRNGCPPLRFVTYAAMSFWVARADLPSRLCSAKKVCAKVLK